MEWLEEIGSYDPLTNEEQHVLIQNWQIDGDMKSRDKLVLHNMRYAISFSKRYTKSNVPIFDLVNQCVIGLLEAIDKFDLSKKNKQGESYTFLTYATWRMLRQVHDLIDCKTVIKQKYRKTNSRISVSLFSELSSLTIPEDHYLDNHESVIQNNNIEYLISDLSDKHKTILLMRINGKTLKYIGDKYNLSRERIRQIVKASCKKILDNKNIT